jgi:hypothetical protein
MKLLLKASTTSQVARVFLQDATSTTGAGLTGLAFGSSGLKWSYIRDDQATVTLVTPATATVGTWTSAGFKEIDATNMPGVYEIGIPNAALASGKSVQMLIFGATNLVPCPVEIELTAVDHQAADLGLGSATLPTNPTAGTFGSALFFADSRIGRRGTAQAGTSSTITLDAGASATDNAYKDHSLKITGGTGAGQFATIVAYNGTTKVATILRPGVGGTWSTTPDSTSVFLIEPRPMVDLLPTQAFANSSAPVPPTASQNAAAVWTDATSGDFTATNSAGLKLMGLVGGPAIAQGAVVNGSTGAAVVVSGLPSGKSYVGQHLHQAATGEARTIASQTYASGNYTLNFTGTTGTEAGPFSAVTNGEVMIPLP